ncbi:MAG: hypothetical protein D6728_06930 [Cyanobacteria bacterium J055]|nr:MAG: hypothetical protein D6728_06930 [Cyanobacteria bacterium J055]
MIHNCEIRHWQFSRIIGLKNCCESWGDPKTDMEATYSQMGDRYFPNYDINCQDEQYPSSLNARHAFLPDRPYN